MAEIITKNILSLSQPLEFKKSDTPQVILFSGVNGAGKTTTIAKIASQEIKKGKKVKKGYTIGRVSEELIFEVTQKSYHINPIRLFK